MTHANYLDSLLETNETIGVLPKEGSSFAKVKRAPHGHVAATGVGQSRVTKHSHQGVAVIFFRAADLLWEFDCSLCTGKCFNKKIRALRAMRMPLSLGVGFASEACKRVREGTLELSS